ncbi:uncharacterized protein LOC144148874 isoform X2 [Haemaphysalis longicornis]
MSAKTRTRCSVVGCETSDKSNHVVPQQPELRKVWLQRIGLRTTDTRKFIYVCDRHFSPDAYSMNPQLMRAMGFSRKQQLRTDAVPTLHLPTPRNRKLPKGSARPSAVSSRQALPRLAPRLATDPQATATAACYYLAAASHQAQAMPTETPSGYYLLAASHELQATPMATPPGLYLAAASHELQATPTATPPGLYLAAASHEVQATPTATPSGPYRPASPHHEPEQCATCALAVQAGMLSPCKHTASTQTSVEHMARSIGTQAYLGIKLLVSVKTQTWSGDGRLEHSNQQHLLTP